MYQLKRGVALRLLVISDIHGNMHALDAVINSAENYDRVIFVGDSVDYGPNPGEVVDWLRENADIIVMGNHDNAVAWGVDCRCGEKTHELSVYTRENISLKLLHEDQINYLREMPLRKVIEIDGLKLYIVHGSPRVPLYGYVYPDLPDNELSNLLIEKSSYGVAKKIKSDFIILGHTHIPMIRRINNSMIVNPGSVGQPRDVDTRASFAILNTEKRSFEIQRVKYPIDEVISRIKELNLDKKYEKWIIALLKTADVDQALRIISS